MHKRPFSISNLALLSALVAASAAACGGSSSSSSNGGNMTCTGAPCGGDVVGNWKASSTCIDSATVNMEFLSSIMGQCPTASLTNVKVTPSGTMTFGADLTYTTDVSMTMSFTENIPTSCVSGASCATVNAALQAEVGTNGITAVNCTGSSTCACAITAAMVLDMSSGTYTTAGTILTLTATSGTSGDSGDYCVQGSSLHLLSIDTSMSMAKVVSDFVFTKQ